MSTAMKPRLMSTRMCTTSITSISTTPPGMASSRTHTRIITSRCAIGITTTRICITATVTEFSLPPSAALEPEDRQQDTQRDQRQAVGIAPAPPQLRHVVEVHAVHAGYQRRGNPHYRYHREYPEDLVLLGVDEAENCVQQELRLAAQ